MRCDASNGNVGGGDHVVKWMKCVEKLITTESRFLNDDDGTMYNTT